MRTRNISIGSDLEKIDAHETAAAEYDETPEQVEVGGKPVRGRPKLADRKQLISMRLDSDVVEALRATGPGWQTRANGILRTAMVTKSLEGVSTDMAAARGRGTTED